MEEIQRITDFMGHTVDLGVDSNHWFYSVDNSEWVGPFGGRDEAKAWAHGLIKAGEFDNLSVAAPEPDDEPDEPEHFVIDEPEVVRAPRKRVAKTDE